MRYTHGVQIADGALVAAATLIYALHKRSDFLPDKAIDLVDEAAAKLKMEITSKPEELDEVESQNSANGNGTSFFAKRERSCFC